MFYPITECRNVAAASAECLNAAVIYVQPKVITSTSNAVMLHAYHPESREKFTLANVS